MPAAVKNVTAMTILDDMNDVLKGLKKFGLKLLKSGAGRARNEASPHRRAELVECADVEVQAASHCRFDTPEFVDDDFLERKSQGRFMKGD